MSTDYYVYGFRPPDEKFKKMAKVWNTCVEAGVAIPDEVADFFAGEAPDKAGVCVDLKKLPCCSVRKKDGEFGFDVDVSKLPKDVKIVRFCVSY
jgi:hypothetical protein